MNGTLKTCPRCKGHGYILGQKKKYKEHSTHLPDYRKNKKGLCFLCDGKKEAFFTDDNRVFKFKKDKLGKVSVIEFCSSTGRLIGEVTDFNLDTLNSKNYNIISDEECLFPSEYESIIGEHSNIIDAILKEHPMSKVVSIDHYYSDDGYTFSFLMYYDKNIELIKPFYTKPTYDELDSLLNGTAIVKDDYSMAVSGAYYENSDSLYLGIKNKEGFNSVTIRNIKDVFNIYKNKPIEKNEISNFINNVSPIHPIMIKILSHILDFVEVNIFDK